MELLKPNSVIDVGCGTGTFLKCFQDEGVQDITGVDGSWVDKSKLHISPDCFIEADLEKKVLISKTYDLVICLEVAEHLSPLSSGILIESLVSLGKVIVFSAAIPNQGGQNHLNEQPFSYWQQAFEKHSYYYYDVFRAQFWNMKEIDWWYKQNMFLVAHQSVNFGLHISSRKVVPLLTTVHPDLYNIRVSEKNKMQAKLEQTKNKLEQIRSGEESFAFYIKLLLLKMKSYFMSSRKIDE